MPNVLCRQNLNSAILTLCMNNVEIRLLSLTNKAILNDAEIHGP